MLTPYYYYQDGTHPAYTRVGNELLVYYCKALNGNNNSIPSCSTFL